MDGSEVDQHNRKVFEEVFKIIKMAWTQDTIEYRGEYYSIPQPYERGESGAGLPRTGPGNMAPPASLMKKGSSEGSASSPKPYQQPHPPLWQPFSVSETTIRWCARENILPWILISHPETFKQRCMVYQEEGIKAGRELELGQSVGAARAISIGKNL